MYTYSVYIMYCRHRDYVYIINHIYMCVCYTTTIQHYWMTHPAAQNKQKIVWLTRGWTPVRIMANILNMWSTCPAQALGKLKNWRGRKASSETIFGATSVARVEQRRRIEPLRVD